MENRRLCQLFQGRKKHTHTLKAPDANEGEGAVNSFQPWPPPKKKKAGKKNNPDFHAPAAAIQEFRENFFPLFQFPLTPSAARPCSLPASSRSLPGCLCIQGLLVPGQIPRPREQDPIPAAPAASSRHSHPCLWPSVSDRASRNSASPAWGSGRSRVPVSVWGAPWGALGASAIPEDVPG